jgi:uncharacterized protein
MIGGMARSGPEVWEIASRVPEAVGGGRGPSREAIADVVALIAGDAGVRRIVLFGSRAWGTPTADSDVDLMVVMETARRPLEEAVRLRQAIATAATFPLDVLVRTPEEVRIGLAEGDFIVREVMGKGATPLEAGDA